MKLGDLVFTYDWRLAQIRELEYGDDKVTGVKVTGARLNTGELVDLYELVRVKYISEEAQKILKERGRCTL